MGTYMMKRKSACFSQEETPNASHSTGREVKRLHCEQHNWGMTAANTLSCCVSHIHTDAHTLGNTHTHTKDTFNQSWRKIVKIKTHVILGDHLLIFISNFPYKHPRQTEERDGKQVCNSRGTEVFWMMYDRGSLQVSGWKVLSLLFFFYPVTPLTLIFYYFFSI